MAETLAPPDPAEIRRVIAAALAEDVGPGDLTSQTVIPAGLVFHGVMAAREEMVVCGLDIASEVFRAVVPEAAWSPSVVEGAFVGAGTILATISGPAQGLLTAERVALNLLQHLSGIATLTRTYVGRLTGTGCILLDTRKTIPGLRQFAKYATRVGGARNHRMGLYDAILIKDNHIAVCVGVQEAVMRAKTAGVSVDLVQGRAKLEASGGVNLDTIRAIAETGVDFVSVGRITQSARAVDIGLDWH